MALRIGQPEAASQPAVLTEEPEAPPTPEEALEAPADEAKFTQDTARYFGPEARCGSCIYFMEGLEGGECELVEGPIDPQGVCSFFQPDELEQDLETAPDAEQAPETPEAVIEEE